MELRSLEDFYDSSMERYYLPAGIVLVSSEGQTLIGDEISGGRTSGCGCCSRSRDREWVKEYLGYYDFRSILTSD